MSLWLIFFFSSIPTPAFAHKLKVFAAPEGTEISGTAYFSSGEKAQDSDVTATTPDGAVLYKGKTDSLGRFRFPAGSAREVQISVDGGDGHVAATRLGGEELAPPSAPSDLQTMIDRSVARQVRPLREQIDAWQDKVWTHDVMGGLGVIVGIAGFAYGWTSRRQREDDA